MGLKSIRWAMHGNLRLNWVRIFLAASERARESLRRGYWMEIPHTHRLTSRFSKLEYSICVQSICYYCPPEMFHWCWLTWCWRVSLVCERMCRPSKQDDDDDKKKWRRTRSNRMIPKNLFVASFFGNERHTCLRGERACDGEQDDALIHRDYTK